MKSFRDEKSMVIAYVLWFFLGHFGVHRMYLRRVKTGVTMLAMIFTVLGVLLVMGLMLEAGTLNETWLTISSFVCIGIFAIWMLWYVADVVLIAVMINNDRKNVETYGTQRMESVFK